MKYFSILLMGALLFAGISCDEEDDDGGTDNGEDAVSLNLVVEGFNSPVFLTESTDNTGRLFVVDQSGQIYIVKNGARLEQPFLDILDKIILEEAPDERGLLGLAFHPDFATNGRFFVYYGGPLAAAAPEGWDHTNYLAEYHATPNADQADAASGRVVLAMDHPQSNHNGGTLAFGDDGYLYISVGDGGGGDDNQNGHVEDWYDGNEGGNGQDITQNLLGNILRIDVTPAQSYGIPPDNPFVNTDGLDEIYAYGLRNPYRFSFGPNSQLIVADAGQELYEEINVVEKGGNYGWNVKEGRHCFSTANPDAPGESCPDEDDSGNALIDPVIEFENSKSSDDGLGTVSIGGYVYTASTVGMLNGKYLFGVLAQDRNVTNGAIFAAVRSGNNWEYDKLSIKNMPGNEIGQLVLALGQDKAGEVYVLTSEGTTGSGKVYRIGQ